MIGLSLPDFGNRDSHRALENSHVNEKINLLSNKLVMQVVRLFAGRPHFAENDARSVWRITFLKGNPKQR